MTEIYISTEHSRCVVNDRIRRVKKCRTTDSNVKYHYECNNVWIDRSAFSNDFWKTTCVFGILCRTRVAAVSKRVPFQSEFLVLETKNNKKRTRRFSALRPGRITYFINHVVWRSDGEIRVCRELLARSFLDGVRLIDVHKLSIAVYSFRRRKKIK